MKSKEEITSLLFLPEFGKHINVDPLVDKILSIQKDALDEGKKSVIDRYSVDSELILKATKTQ